MATEETKEKSQVLPKALMKTLHRRGFETVIRSDGTITYRRCGVRPKKAPKYTAAQLDDAILRLEKFGEKKTVLMGELGIKAVVTLNSWIRKRKEHPELWETPAALAAEAEADAVEADAAAEVVHEAEAAIDAVVAPTD